MRSTRNNIGTINLKINKFINDKLIQFSNMGETIRCLISVYCTQSVVKNLGPYVHLYTQSTVKNSITSDEVLSMDWIGRRTEECPSCFIFELSHAV